MTDPRPPARLNLMLAAGLAAIHLFCFLVVPIWLLPISPFWGLTLLVPVLLTPTLWSLTHEAIHGALCNSQRWNDRIGRVLAVLYAAPFQVLRLGHLMHHRFNRTALNRVEVVETASPSLLDRLHYYARLFGGLYLGEVASAPLAMLPKRASSLLVRLAFEDTLEDGRSMGPAARRQLLEEPGRTRMRIDGMLVVLWLALSFAAFGSQWWMLALALLGRGFVVSFLDNVYHYGNQLDEMRAGSDLYLPGPLRALLLNFNFHGTHHQRPQLPWTMLPDAFASLERRYAGSLASAALRQLHGPIPEQSFDKAPGPGARAP